MQRPHFSFAGTPAQIGYQHGKHLADRVRACYDLYTKTLIQDHNVDFKTLGGRYLEVIGEDTPAYREEMEALALGAELEPWQIAVLNARTEIYMAANSRHFQECTSFFLPQTRVLAQNWDWMKPLVKLMVLLQIKRPDGHELITLTEPGIIGKIGMNNRGLGVCLNILLGDTTDIGVPVHILLRKVLDADTLQSARDRIQSTRFDTHSSLLIANTSGAYANFELKGPDVREVRFDQAPIHTNHYLSIPGWMAGHSHVANSIIRLARGRDLLKEHPHGAVPDMQRILKDTENGEDAICKTFSPFLNADYGTLCAIIMDLPNHTMHVTRGHPTEYPFDAFKL